MWARRLNAIHVLWRNKARGADEDHQRIRGIHPPIVPVVWGLGLNPTAASRVLNIGPFWDLAIEQQAFGRVHRISQTKKTTSLGYFDRRIMNLREESKDTSRGCLKAARAWRARL